MVLIASQCNASNKVAKQLQTTVDLFLFKLMISATIETKETYIIQCIIMSYWVNGWDIQLATYAKEEAIGRVHWITMPNYSTNESNYLNSLIHPTDRQTDRPTINPLSLLCTWFHLIQCVCTAHCSGNY